MDGVNTSLYKLDKSRGLPLDIYAADTNTPVTMDEFVAVIMPESHRWRTLEIVAGTSDTMDMVMAPLRLGAPMLEAIWLGTQGPYLPSIPFPHPHTLPSLRFLSLDAVKIWGTVEQPPCENLERLHISNVVLPSQKALSGLLLGCPNLVLLDFEDVYCATGYHLEPGSPITLERLELFRLSIPNDEWIGPMRTEDVDFWPAMHTPSLRKLSLYCDPALKEKTAGIANVMAGFPDSMGIPTLADAPIPSVLSNTSARFVNVALNSDALAYQVYTSSEDRAAVGSSILSAMTRKQCQLLTMIPVIDYHCDVQPMLFPPNFPTKGFVHFQLDRADSLYEHFQLSMSKFPGTTDLHLMRYHDIGEVNLLIRTLASPGFCSRLQAIHLDEPYGKEPELRDYRSVLEELSRLREGRGASPESDLSVYIKWWGGEAKLKDTDLSS